jgi:protein-disulfide isomerase
VRRLALILVAAVMTLVLFGGGCAFTAGAQQAQVSPQLSTEAPGLDPFEQRVREYLLKNPEVVMEALQILQERQKAAEAESRSRTIAARRDEILNDPAAPVGGNPDGDVTLVEFFDYNCPYCRRVAPTVAEIIAADADLRVVYKEFPILGPGSTFAARAALAAQRQGKYAPLHDALMGARESLDEAQVLEIAEVVGLDTERLQRDMADPAIQDAIARNLQLANALGITGTPSFLVGESIVPGAVDRGTLEGLIARARESE